MSHIHTRKVIFHISHFKLYFSVKNKKILFILRHLPIATHKLLYEKRRKKIELDLENLFVNTKLIHAQQLKIKISSKNEFTVVQTDGVWIFGKKCADLQNSPRLLFIFHYKLIFA